MQRKVKAEYLIFLYFFSSGFAALLYQVVWLKYLNLLFGSTTHATAAVLSAFMFGLAAGSWFSVKFRSLFRSPLRSYGLFEIAVGVFALLFPFIYSGFMIPFRLIFNSVGPQTLWYNILTFLLAFAVLLIPTSLMGATLPLLSQYVMQEGEDDKNKSLISRKIGYLYAVNTIGAVAGIIFSAFLFIPNLGLHATISVGVLINLSVGLLCYVTGKEKLAFPGEVKESRPGANRLLPLYAVSGLLALSYEVLWTRILVLHLGSSVYAYAIMLAVFLLGISCGSYASGKWLCKRTSHLEYSFGWIQAAWAFSILLQILQFSFLNEVLYDIATLFRELTITTHFIILFLGTLQLLFLPTFLSGALFPVMVTRLAQQSYPVPYATSLSYSVNTVGGIFGSLLAGFVLIPLFGTQNSLCFLAFGNLALAALALHPRTLLALPSRKSLIAGVILILFAVGAFLIQKNVQILRTAGPFKMQNNEKLVHLEEDSAATISVEIRNHLKEPYHSLSINGVNVAGTSPNLISIQKLQGHIPMIIHGTKGNTEVLHIGFGSGGTAYSVSLYPNTNITVVELSRAVVRNAHRYFRSVNFGIVGSGKLNVIFFDGRSYLQNTQKNYDVILSDSIHPRYSGNGSLYTKDYYQLVYSRLNQGGVHSQWIPLYSLTLKNLKEILKAFNEVFPETYVWYINSTINPYIIVTGTKGKSGIQALEIQKAFQQERVAKDLQNIGISNEYFLLDYFLLGKNKLQNFLADIEAHSDDRLTVEYESSRIRSRTTSWWANFRALLEQREKVYPYLSDSPTPVLSVYERFYKSTASNLLGQLLFLENKPKEAKLQFQKAQETNVDDRDPYEYTHLQF